MVIVFMKGWLWKNAESAAFGTVSSFRLHTFGLLFVQRNAVPIHHLLAIFLLIILLLVNLYIATQLTLYKLVESLPHVEPSLGWSLSHLQVVLYAEVHHLLLADSPCLGAIFNQIVLVGNNDGGRLGSLEFGFDLMEPYFQIFEGLLVSYVEHDEDAVAFAIIGAGYTLVLFGSC